MPILNSRAQCNDLIASINAELAVMDAGRTSVIANLESMVIRYAILRDIKFPGADDPETGLLRIDCGGPGNVDWNTDQDFHGGSTGSVSPGQIVRTDVDAAPTDITASYRINWNSYTITLAAGTYRFRFTFDDTINSTTGQRIFDLFINGDRYLDDYDIIANSGGTNKTDVQDIIVTVAAGVTTISATPSVGATLINAIKILDATGETPTTPIPDVADPVNNIDWYWEWWNNVDFTGPSILQERLATTGISFAVGVGAPRPTLPADNFCMRLQKLITFTAASWTFYLNSLDDGGRVYIDDVLVLESWIQQAPNDYHVDVVMTAGEHLIRVEYKDVLYTGSMEFSYALTAAGPPPPPPPGVGFHGAYTTSSSFSGAQNFQDNVAQHECLEPQTFIDLPSGVSSVVASGEAWIAGDPTRRRCKLGINTYTQLPNSGNIGSTPITEITDLCNAIVATGHASQWDLRPLYEGNGNFGFPWMPRNHGDNFAGFVDYGRRVHTAIKAVYDFPVYHNFIPWDDYDYMAECYWGDAYCDVISIDVYESWTGGDLSQRAAQALARLDKGIAFARSHGKPWAIDEWANRTVSNGGAGDNPYFIDAIFNRLDSESDWVSQTFYNSGEGGVDETLIDTPDSLLAFRTRIDAFA